MSIGKMRHRIELQQPLAVKDAGGGLTITWQSVEEVDGQVKPVSAREMMHAMGINNPVTHRVKLRYRADLKPDWRLVYDGRTFKIASNPDPDERKRYLELMVEEGLPV
jgi:SPP1 family predicted phage head-tail adaptor